MSSSYAKVIVNPVAGAGRTGREWPRIMDMFRGNGLHFDYDITEAPGHAIELARESARNGYDMVVSVGGDGTINEIVNGLYTSGNIRDTTLGIVSTGTGSDYIRTVGIPRRSEDACRCLLRLKKRVVDLGIVAYTKDGRQEERLFVNFAGFGFDAEIVRRTTQQFKSLGAVPSYLLGIFATLMFYRNHDISIEMDGESLDMRVCTVVMNNGRYGGGSMFTAPHAELADGLLDVMIVGDLSKPDLLWSIPRIYKGTHLTHPKVTMKRAKEVEVESLSGKMQLQADGELLGEIPARFRVLPSMLNIII